MNNFFSKIKQLATVLLSSIIIIILILHGTLDIIVFKSLELRYKREVKQLIKSGIPEEDLVIIKFQKNQFENETAEFEWTKKREFRYKNEMYDIIRSEYKSDSVYLYCYHDLKESGLFSGLENKIKNHLAGNPDQSNKIKSIFNLINKYYEEGRGIASPITYHLESDYPAPYQENELNGYISIHLPPPKYKVST